MAEAGRYEKLPRPEHIEFLIGGLMTKPTVASVTQIDAHHYDVERYDKSSLRIFLTNQYLLGLAEVIAILAESPDTNCIVSTMNYNHVAPEAKQFCMDQHVAVFRTAELFGAVYYDGDRFLRYMPPERR